MSCFDKCEAGYERICSYFVAVGAADAIARFGSIDIMMNPKYRYKPIYFDWISFKSVRTCKWKEMMESTGIVYYGGLSLHLCNTNLGHARTQ
jgi:hypothetical protein